MKNLVVVGERLSQLPLDALHADGASQPQPLDAVATALDASSGTLFVATRSHLLFAWSLAQRSLGMCVTLPLAADDVVVSVRYQSELECVAVASARGDLLTVALDGPPDVEPHVALVERVDSEEGGGIAAMAFSPDEELCALLLRGTAAGGPRLQLRTKDLDVMYESELFPAASGAAFPSAAALRAAYDRFGTGALSWRGDGQFLVVNALDARAPAAPQRHTIVFDRQLERQSCSAPMKPEPIDGSSDGMGVPLVWRPSGNLYFTAATRTISSQLTKHELWAFEKNGLRHGDIALENILGAPAAASASAPTSGAAAPVKKPRPARRRGDDDEEDDEEDLSGGVDAPPVDESAVDAATSTASAARSHRVLDLSWNVDSDMFAVLIEERASGAQSLLLYSIGNYKWYVKQEIRPSVANAGPDGRPTRMRALWHSEDARRLVVVESGGLVRAIDFAWDACVSGGAQARTAAVLDGQAVLLTPLARQIVPPPMSAWKVLLPSALGRAAAVSFRASPLGARLAARGLAKFTLPNGAHEAAAFVPDDEKRADGEGEEEEEEKADVEPLPASACPRLFSPTSDLLIQTSARRVVLIENVEESLGPGMQPMGTALAALQARGCVHSFSLDSEDFPLGNLRDLVWLDEAAGTDETLEDRAAAAAAEPLPTSSISERRPAMVLAVESGVWPACDQLVEMEVFDGEIQSMFRTPVAAPLQSKAASQSAAHSGSSVHVVRMSVQKELGHVFVQLSSGRVLRYLPAAWQPELSADDRVPVLEAIGSPSAPLQMQSGVLALPTSCPWFCVVRLGGRCHAMGRDALGKLFVGATLLTPQCSSFIGTQHPLYAVFTILGQQNAAFLLDKSLSLEENMSEQHRADPNAVRLLERGSALVTVIPSLAAPRMILQMPRGNLEAIYPRALTLSALNAALSSLRIPEAFESVRRNKIDPNILVDHFAALPGGFRRVVDELIDQLAEGIPGPGRAAEYLNVLISALTEESSLDNQYVAYKPRAFTPSATLALEARAKNSGASNGATNGGMDAVREKLMRAAAAAASAKRADGGAGGDGGDDDDLDSVGSARDDIGHGASADTLAPHDAVGEDAPYNYVPRKPGQSRRPLKTKAARIEHGKGVRSREEQRRVREIAERAEREALATAYEASLAAASDAGSASKVNSVCGLLRSALLARQDKERWTLCVLTTFLREEPKQYDAALAMVKEMRDKEKEEEKNNGPAIRAAAAVPRSTGPVAVARTKESSRMENKSAQYAGYRGALQYMIFLSDIETLYECALGIYDFELVRLVAQYSHMDPKEYIAFLDKLQAMDAEEGAEADAAAVAGAGAGAGAASTATAKEPRKRTPHFQHYSIDLHLGRHAKALASLLASWRANEIPHDQEHWNLVLQLLRNHPELYTQALEIMAPEQMRDTTRLMIGGGGGGGGGFGGRDSSGGMYGASAPFDPTGGLPAHFLNPSLAPPTVASSSQSMQRLGGGGGGGSGGSSSSAPEAEQSPESIAFNSLLVAYGTYLCSSSAKPAPAPRHAAHAFLLACEYERAVQALKEAGEWRECMALAAQLNYQQHQIQQLAYDLSAQLRTETKTCIAAAQLLAEYCDDVDEAVVVLLSGEQWFEILRVCYARGREDLLETHVQGELMRAFATHLKHIQTHRQRYVYAVTRLRIIRRVKLLFPPSLDGVQQGGVVGGERNERDDDLASIVSGATASTSYSSASRALSDVSAFSGRSTATVASTSSLFSIQSDTRRDLTPDEKRIARHHDKLRRKNVQKRVKEGSVFEEEMMISEVVKTTPLDKHRERMSELIHALLHFGYHKQARTLQTELKQWMDVVAREEAKPMPMMDNPTPEQRRALIEFWNWPQMAHPDRNVTPRSDHLLMPFLFPAPSTTAAAQAQQQKQGAGAASVSTSAPSPPAADEEDDGDMMLGFM